TVRLGRNPRYSLRAFARDLGLGPTRLSEILSGKQGLSSLSAQKIAQKMGLSREESEIFVLQVESQHGRSALSREMAKEKLKKIALIPDRSLNPDLFHIIAEWYHLAILELTRLKGFQSNSNWIAERLNLSVMEVDLALKRLLSLNLLK